jgi:hypothetical protein
MHLRDLQGTTLGDIANQVGTGPTDLTVEVNNNQIHVDLDGGMIELAPEGKSAITLPATLDSLMALGNWLEVPTKFLRRLDPDMQQYTIQTLLNRQSAQSNVVYDETRGIRQILEPRQKLINPATLVEAVTRVIDPSAPVSDFWSNPSEFRLDVMAPEGFHRGIGGDPQVGDITRGGIRVFRDVAHNLAPSVAKWMFRLHCTNGMEIEDPSLKVEARGGTVEEVLEEFEEMAERAFTEVERDIAAFYELRTTKVENPERTLVRIGDEQGLSPRTVVSLVEEVPTITGADGAGTMFDIVNLITNRANDPHLRRRSGVRRRLEQVGGQIVSEHVERCSHCQSQLVKTN